MSKLKLLDGTPNEIVTEREFDAPSRLVKLAMTTPELIKRWSGGKRAVVTDAQVDLRVGGRWRTGYRTHDGHEFAFVGEYREIGDERIVHTEQMEGQPGHAIVTTTLTGHAGKTTMRVVMAFDSPDVREMVFATGMTEGAGESYDALDAVLAGL